MTKFFTFNFVLCSIFRLCTSVYAGVIIPHYSTLVKEQQITLLDDYSYLINLKQATTISDIAGIDHGGYRFVVDEFTKLEHFEAVITDTQTGKVIKRIKEKDLKSRALIGEGTFFQNLVLMYFELEQIRLPAKVEMEVRLKKQGNFNLPTWYPTSLYHQKVVSSKLKIQYPESLGLRHKSTLLTPSDSSSEVPGVKSLVWEATDMQILQRDTPAEEVPKLELAPVHFSMQGYTATMSSWEAMGQWFHKLNQGKDLLPEETKKLVKELTEGLTDDFEKVQVLYTYLQKNYRYVSIQMGLGGWMPIEASRVVSSKYGDCKALTMLMKSLLAEAGIPAIYTLVSAGEDEEPLDLTFPSNQFNHVILQVPLAEDTVWLECTSNTLPTGYLGSFTKNRPALAITEDGGKIVRTPNYHDPKFNTTQIRLAVRLVGSGDAEIDGNVKQQGFPAESLHQLAYHLGDKEKKEYLLKRIGGIGLNLDGHDLLVNVQRDLPVAEISFNGWVGRYAQKTAKRTIIPVSWAKGLFHPGDTFSGSFEEETTVTLPGELSWESGESGWELNTDFIQATIKPRLEGSLLKIIKTIHYSFPEDFSVEEKATEMKKVNMMLQEQFILKKQL